MTRPIPSTLFYYPDSELVFGIVSPIGIDYRPAVTSLVNYLEQFGYISQEVKISSAFESTAEKLNITIEESSYTGQAATMWRKIKLGDEICAKAGTEDFLALLAAAMIEKERETNPDNVRENLPSRKTAHIVISLKRPEEVATLRRIYGPGFFLIGLAADDTEREKFFEERGFSPEARNSFVAMDAAESTKFGQRTRDTFYLSDVFIPLKDTSGRIARFLDLVFGNPFHTPTLEERSMYLAYAASLGSGDLARQVGAALVDDLGDCLGLGWNDVPKAHGGLYGPESGSKRDMDRGDDSNDTEKLDIAAAILAKLDQSLTLEEARSSARDRLEGTGFFDITEFGRAVHAEMAALLAAARTGRTTREATLFVTTFPCHNCTRHILASGVKRVYYIEPYAKSKAFKLHGDACQDGQTSEPNKIPFLPFIGVGPRRFLDLFSMSLGTGHPVERKRNGVKLEWGRDTAVPRLQMAAVSYLEREQLASTTLNAIVSSAQGTISAIEVQHEEAGTNSLATNQ